MNIEFARPEHFVPPLRGSEDRHVFIDTIGRASWYHYAPVCRRQVAGSRVCWAPMHGHAPLPPDVRDTIALWASDFVERPVAAEPVARVGSEAPAILAAFLEGACHGGTAPADIEGAEVAHGLLEHLADLSLPPASRDAVPGLVAAFLADLQDVGRLAGGHALAAQVRASAPAFRERAAGRVRQERRVAPKVGRNDPCPCGSGRKYKRCCLRALD